MRQRQVTILAICVALLGCSDDSNNSPTDAATSSDAPGSLLGPAGGTVAGPGGVLIEVPAGALTSDVKLTIGVSTTPWPMGIKTHSALYEFGPAGTQFAKPVTVTLPSDGSEPQLLRVYWSAPGGGALQALTPLSADASTVKVSVSHFSLGGIGELQSCGGSDSCKDAACPADAECTFGGVCSGKLKQADGSATWVCLTNKDCAARCTATGVCNARNLCTSSTMPP